jgi:hypothetical protein
LRAFTVIGAIIVLDECVNIFMPLCNNLVESFLARMVIACYMRTKWYPPSCSLVLEEQVEAADQLVKPGSHEEKYG